MSIVDWSALPEEQWAVFGHPWGNISGASAFKFQHCKLGGKGEMFPIDRWSSHFDDFRCPIMGDFPLPCLPAQSPMSPWSADGLWIHPATIPWARFKIDLGHKTMNMMNYWPLWVFTMFHHPIWCISIFWPPFWTHNKIITRFLVLFACCCDPMVNDAGGELWCVAATRVDQVNRVQSGSPFLPVGKIGGSCENHLGFGRLRAKCCLSSFSDYFFFGGYATFSDKFI